MFPPMPKAPTLPGMQQPKPDQQAFLPGVEPLGGGAIQPMPQPEQMMGGRSAGPMMPEPMGETMTATAMPKPMGESPLPKPQPQAAPTQGAAKPQQAGPMAPPEGMPPPIRAPRAPNYGAQTPQAANVAAQGASAGQFDVNAFRPFADAVYSEATRQLDPMMQQREADFRQRMVNQGLQEGTEAYDKAFANFSRERNDAYGSARNQALAQALGAQNQFFGQSAANAQMANQMQQFNASNALQAAGLGQADRQFGANLGLQYGQLGQQAQMANAANWINQNQFGRNLDFNQSRADMSDLMALLGYGQQATQYNNNLLGVDQQRAGALFGLIPGLAPTQLDVMGAANMANQQIMQGRQLQQDARNGTMQAIGQLGGAALMMSDRRLKTDIEKVGKLHNGLDVYAYRYIDGGPRHIGVMADEVQAVKPDAVAEVGGFLAVDYTEAVK